MQQTSNYNLLKYEDADYFSKDNLNSNMDIIDTALKDMQDTINTGSGSTSSQEIVDARKDKATLLEEVDYLQGQITSSATEITNAKKGKTTLLDKVNEIDTRLDLGDEGLDILSLGSNAWGYKGICVRGYFDANSGKGFTSQYYKDRISECVTKLGIDSVEIIPNRYQATDTSTNVEYRTPVTIEDTRHLINYCKGLGLKVALCPHIESDTGGWRGTFVPTDANAWFTSYKAMIEKFATLAEETKCDLFFVGSEYKTLTVSTYRSNWETIISSVRSLYSGTLTYGANCSNASTDEYSTLCFWDLVDVIGIDCYLTPTDTTTTPLANYDQLMYSNKDGSNLYYSIHSLVRSYNKPLIFAEYGVSSADDTYHSNYLECYLKNYGGLPYNAGMFLWTIDPSGVANNFYPVNRTAEAMFKKYYATKTKPYRRNYDDLYTTTMSGWSDTNIYWTKIATVKLINNSISEGCITLTREQLSSFDRPTVSDLFFRIDSSNMSSPVNVVLKLGQNAFVHASNITYVKIQDDTNYKIVDIYIKIAQYVQYSFSLTKTGKNKFITLYDKQPLLSAVPAGTSGNPTSNILLSGYVTGTTASGLINHTVDLHFPTPSSVNDINISYTGATLTSLTGGNTYDVNLSVEIVDGQHIKITGKHLVDTTNRAYTIKWLVVGY